MKKIEWVIFLIALAFTPLHAQKVGLVLSGGGAKGVAHIGMIQALEDNGIPIDYITGTSIGAVVGGLYAMGYSPQEMLALIKSDEFDRWKSGKIEDKYLNHFRLADPTPEVISTSISLKDSVLDPRKLLPNSLLNPIQMNLAFMQLTAQSTAFCNRDFNALFVPFRSIASSISERKSYVFRKGDLGDAIRASMTFPLVFKAIRVEDQLLYDGGIYNNYPVDVMQSDFQPDIMLGCIVDNAGKVPDDYDMYAQFQRMIMHPTKDSIKDGSGIQLQLDLEEISLLSFDKADSVYKVGYDGAMKFMDSIKNMIHRRVDPFTLLMKRHAFKSQLPQFRFKQIEINGVTELQKDYIVKILKQDGTQFFSLDEFKQGYFKLLTGGLIIKEILPHAQYIEADDAFKLILDVEVDNSLDVAFGFNLSSAFTNQLYLGISYEALNELSQVYAGDLYIGKFHTGLNVLTQFNLLNDRLPSYLKLKFSALSYNYFMDEKLFYQSDLPAFLSQYESFLKVSYGIPFLKTGKLEAALGGAFLMDAYMQEKPLVYSLSSYDRSVYGFGSFSVTAYKNSLNSKQYPTDGALMQAGISILSGAESYRYPDSVGNLAKSDKILQYFQIRGAYERYVHFDNQWVMGVKSELVYNNKRTLDNYTSSVIQAVAFTPTPHSKTVFNEAFRANQFVALGVVPIWKIKPALHWRTDLYGFLPMESLHPGPNHQAVKVRTIRDFQYLFETALIYDLSFTKASLYINKYSAPEKNWNVGLNLGFLLFPKRYLD
jgi:NTE family protein